MARARQAAVDPSFADYEKKTGRLIPVAALSRVRDVVARELPVLERTQNFASPYGAVDTPTCIRPRRCG